MTRRQALGMALAAPAIISARSSQAADTVKIGMIMTMSGPFASSGDWMRKGCDLFMKYKAPEILNGIPVEVIVRDDGGANPDVAKRLVQEFVVRDKVQYLGGIQWSPNAIAVAPLITQAKLPCVITNAGTSSIVRMSPNFARVSHTMWQSAYVLGQWAARNNYKSVYTMVTDFTGGIDAEQAFTKGLVEAGGSIKASVRMPMQSPNFVPFMQRARDEKPDAVFAFHPGGSATTPFLKAYAEVGLEKAGIRLIGPGDITSDEELSGVGEVAAGVLTAFHYSAAADRPANKEYLDLWYKDYGKTIRPNYMSTATWDGMRAICTAIAATKGAPSLDGAMAVLRGYSDPGSPRGPISIDPDTRDIVQNEYIREVRMVDGQAWNIEQQTIAAVKDPWKILNPA